LTVLRKRNSSAAIIDGVASLNCELLRVKGELLLLQDASGAAAAAEDNFRQALDWACRQDALSCELARRHEFCSAAA
jgi:hypothetical protein